MKLSLTQLLYTPAHFIATMACMKGGGKGEGECINVVSVQFKLEQPPPHLHPSPAPLIQLQGRKTAACFGFHSSK